MYIFLANVNIKNMNIRNLINNLFKDSYNFSIINQKNDNGKIIDNNETTIYPNLNENLEFFSIRDDGFKCKVCSKQDTSVLEMSKSTKSAIMYTITAPAKKLYSFSIKDEALEEFKLITKIYFNQKLEKDYKLEELF